MVTCPGRDGLLVATACGPRADGAVEVSVTPGRELPPHVSLAVRLCAMLADPRRAGLRRSGWIAWGCLTEEGEIGPALLPPPNGLPAGPCVGQIWYPDDRLPSLDQDAVIAVTHVGDLEDALGALELFASMEDAVYSIQGLPRPASAPPIDARGSATVIVEGNDLLPHQTP
jgi:hypothetical protein